MDTVSVFKNGNSGEIISNATPGQALAQALGQRATILLHGHSEVVVGASIPEVVDRCIQLDLNARVQHDILTMGGKPLYLQHAGERGCRARVQPARLGCVDARGEQLEAVSAAALVTGCYPLVHDARERLCGDLTW